MRIKKKLFSGGRHMTNFVRVELPYEKLTNITSKERFYEILDKPDIEFLDSNYPDLEISKGFFDLKNGFVREEHDFHKWEPIVSKLAQAEEKFMEIRFFYDHEDEIYGFRAYPDGKVNVITLTWEEVERMIN